MLTPTLNINPNAKPNVEPNAKPNPSNQRKGSRHFAQPSLLRFGEKNAKTKTNR